MKFAEDARLMGVESMKSFSIQDSLTVTDGLSTGDNLECTPRLRRRNWGLSQDYALRVQHRLLMLSEMVG
jgi:hypothetical protein